MKKIKLITIFSFILLLNSCSLVSEFYIQNFQNNDVNLVIKFTNNVDEEILQRGQMLISSNVNKIQKFKNAQDKKTINYQIVTKNSISIKIPKNSINFIDYAVNKRTNISEIKIETDNKENVLEIEKIEKLAKFKSGKIIFEIK